MIDQTELYSKALDARKAPKKRKALIAAIALCLAAAACAGIAFFALQGQSQISGGNATYAAGTTLVSADGMSAADTQAYVDKLTEQSAMTTAVPSPITVQGTRAFAVHSVSAKGEKTFIPVIQNPAENTRDMKVKLVLDAQGEGDAQETLYETDGFIKAGEGFEQIDLARDLDPGEHAASAVFEGYDPQTHELLGTRIWSVTLIAD